MHLAAKEKNEAIQPLDIIICDDGRLLLQPRHSSPKFVYSGFRILLIRRTICITHLDGASDSELIAAPA